MRKNNGKNGKHTGSLGKIYPLQEGAKMEAQKLPEGQWGGGGGGGGATLNLHSNLAALNLALPPLSLPD